MTVLSNPLKRMRVTQPFGVNWVAPGFYRNLGIPGDGHNGVDFSAVNVPIYSEADGWLECHTSSDGSNNIRLWVDWEPKVKLEIMHFHCSEMAPNRMNVKRGEQIGVTGNSGKYTTGPHLHLGVRMWDENGIREANNGYGGCIDPEYVFPMDWLDLPVDKRYGNQGRPEVPSDLVFYATNAWFWKTMKRLMTTRERNAFQYGFWDIRTVLDPAMYPVWEEMDKPTAIKKGIVKL